MQRDLGIDAVTTNIAVALTSLFSGIFIVVSAGWPTGSGGCGSPASAST